MARLYISGSLEIGYEDEDGTRHVSKNVLFAPGTTEGERVLEHLNTLDGTEFHIAASDGDGNTIAIDWAAKADRATWEPMG
jgi:hypothetical protein